MSPLLIVVLVGLGACSNALGWLLYQRFGSRQPRTMSPRDGGLPHGIIPPRSRWTVAHGRCGPGLAWRTTRMTQRAARAVAASQAYTISWPAWSLTVAAFTHSLVIQRRSERWMA